MCKVYERNGFKVYYGSIYTDDNWCFLRLSDSKKNVWVQLSSEEKHTITYDKFMELFGNKQPEIGDVVKAWDDDKIEFVYGVLVSIDKDSGYPYNIGLVWAKNIEKVIEININDFKK